MIEELIDIKDANTLIGDDREIVLYLLGGGFRSAELQYIRLFTGLHSALATDRKGIMA